MAVAIASGCAGTLGQGRSHAAKTPGEKRAELLGTVGLTSAAGFFAAGGFLVYAGNDDEQRRDFSAELRDAAGIEVQAGIALVMGGVIALAVGAHYAIDVLPRERAREAAAAK